MGKGKMPQKSREAEIKRILDELKPKESLEDSLQREFNIKRYREGLEPEPPPTAGEENKSYYDRLEASINAGIQFPSQQDTVNAQRKGLLEAPLTPYEQKLRNIALEEKQIGLRKARREEEEALAGTGGSDKSTEYERLVDDPSLSEEDVINALRNRLGLGTKQKRKTEYGKYRDAVLNSMVKSFDDISETTMMTLVGKIEGLADSGKIEQADGAAGAGVPFLNKPGMFDEDELSLLNAQSVRTLMSQLLRARNLLNETNQNKPRKLTF